MRITERLSTVVQLNAELLAENSTLTKQLHVWLPGSTWPLHCRHALASPAVIKCW